MAKVQAQLSIDTKTGMVSIKQFEKTANASLNRVGKTGTSMASSIGAGLSKAAKIGSVALAGLAAVGIKQALKFEERFGNVKTLLSDDAPIKQYEKSLLDLGKRGFGDVSELADGLYQTISAGVKGSANQIQFLEKATIGAKLGLASTFEAVDLGTTILNSFGLQASESGRVFDEIQATIQQGKTTFRELAGSIGQVAPAFSLAKQSTSEMFAAISTLTASGLSTEQAITGAKNAVLSIIKPQEDAVKAAKKYGIELNVAALESKGFAGFMQEVKEKTGGSAEALTQIFPNIRAFTAAAILAGNGSEKLAEDLDVVSNSVGKQANEWVEAQKRADITFDKIKNSANAALVEGFQPLIHGIADWFNQGDRIQGFGDTINKVIRGIAEFVGDLGSKFVEYGQALAGAFTDFDIMGVLGNLKTAFDNVFNAVVGFIKSDAGKSLAKFFGDIVELAAKVIGGLSGMVKPLTDIIGKFAWIADFGSGVIDFFSGVADWLGGGKVLIEEYTGAVHDLTDATRDLNKEDTQRRVAILIEKDIQLRNEIELTQDLIKQKEKQIRVLGKEHPLNVMARKEIEFLNDKLKGQQGELRLVTYGLTAGSKILSDYAAGERDATKATEALGEETGKTGGEIEKVVVKTKKLDTGFRDLITTMPKVRTHADLVTTAFLDMNKAMFPESELTRVMQDAQSLSTQLKQTADNLVGLGMAPAEAWRRAGAIYASEIESVQTRLKQLGLTYINLDLNTSDSLRKAEQAWLEHAKKVLAAVQQVMFGISIAYGGVGGNGGTASGGINWSNVGKGAADAFAEAFQNSLQNLGEFGRALAISFGSAFTGGLNKWFNEAFSEKFVNSFAGKLVAAAFPVIGQLVTSGLSQIGSWIAGAIGGPSNEELMAMQGEQLGKAWGEAFTAEAQAAFQKAAESLPRAGSGKVDVLLASRAPGVLEAILAGFSSFTQDLQSKIATEIGHGVNMFKDKLGISLKESFEKFVPTLESAVSKALEFGEKLNPELQSLINHAQNLGVEFSGLQDIFSNAIDELIKGGDLSVEKLNNIMDTAKQLGVDISDQLGEAVSSALSNISNDLDKTFRQDGVSALDDWMTEFEKLRPAMEAVGKDVEGTFDQIIKNMREGIKQNIEDLKAQRDELNTSLVSWEIKRFEMQKSHEDYRKSVIDAGAKSRFEEWQKQNAEMLKGLTEQERKELEIGKQAEFRNQAQDSYANILKKVNDLQLDGKHDIRDIRDAAKELTGEEREQFYELLKQRQEREAHKQQLKDIKEQRRLTKDALKDERELQKSLQDWTEKTKLEAFGIADNLQKAVKPINDVRNSMWSMQDAIYRAKQDWEWMVRHPLPDNGGGKRASGGPIYGQQTYTVGEEGTEFVMQNRAVQRYGMDFMRAINQGVYQPQNVQISPPQPTQVMHNIITVHALDAKSLEQYLRTGNNANVVANAVVNAQRYNGAER